MAQRYTVGEGQILWQGVTSDHAMVSYPLIGAHSFIQIPRTRWRCLDAEAAASWTLKNCPNGFEDVFALMDFARTLQDHNIDDRPRKQRRAQRQNFQQRSLQRRTAECTDDFERRHLIRTAKGIHNIVHATEQRRQDHAAARRGSGINHKKHLHKVEAVLLTEENHAGKGGQLSFDEHEITKEIEHVFGKKWCTNRPEDWVHICDLVFAAEGLKLNFDSKDVGRAIDRIGDHQKLDAHGICVQALKFIHIVHPDRLLGQLRRCAADTTQINALKITGKAFGKLSSRTSAKNMRAILPLPSVLQVLDAIIARQLDAAISHAIQQAPENHIGARRGTQCLDILHPLQLMAEKCNDTGVDFTIGQMDIAAYYDNLPLAQAVWLKFPI